MEDFTPPGKFAQFLVRFEILAVCGFLIFGFLFFWGGMALMMHGRQQQRIIECKEMIDSGAVKP